MIYCLAIISAAFIGREYMIKCRYTGERPVKLIGALIGIVAASAYFSCQWVPQAVVAYGTWWYLNQWASTVKASAIKKVLEPGDYRKFQALLDDKHGTKQMLIEWKEGGR